MINYLSLSKYLTFFVLPAVCGNALATEPDGSFEAALYDAVISNLMTWNPFAPSEIEGAK